MQVNRRGHGNRRGRARLLGPQVFPPSLVHACSHRLHLALLALFSSSCPPPNAPGFFAASHAPGAPGAPLPSARDPSRRASPTVAAAGRCAAPQERGKLICTYAGSTLSPCVSRSGAHWRPPGRFTHDKHGAQRAIRAIRAIGKTFTTSRHPLRCVQFLEMPHPMEKTSRSAAQAPSMPS